MRSWWYIQQSMSVVFLEDDNMCNGDCNQSPVIHYLSPCSAGCELGYWPLLLQWNFWQPSCLHWPVSCVGGCRLSQWVCLVHEPPPLSFSASLPPPPFPYFPPGLPTFLNPSSHLQGHNCVSPWSWSGQWCQWSRNSGLSLNLSAAECKKHRKYGGEWRVQLWGY